MALSFLPRRRFLSAIAAIATIAPVVLTGAGWLRLGRWLSVPARAGLAGLLPNPAVARAIGLSYLAQAPGEADRSALTAQVFGGAEETGSASGIRRTLAAKRDRDFAEGDTVVLDGWIVARTEARFCALIALS